MKIDFPDPSFLLDWKKKTLTTGCDSRYISILSTQQAQVGWLVVLSYSVSTPFGLLDISIVFVYKQLNIKTLLFQAIQFSISTQFSSIWPQDRTLSSATTPGQSGPVSDGNEGELRISQSSGTTGTSPSDSLVSYPGHSIMGGFFFTPLQRSIQCILQP